MASVESRGVKTASVSLISSVVTTSRKAKAERQRWIIYFLFALAAISAWGVSIQLMTGTQSSPVVQSGGIVFGRESNEYCVCNFL